MQTIPEAPLPAEPAKKERPKYNMAHVHIYQFYRKLEKGRQYGPSLLDMVRSATSKIQVDALVSEFLEGPDNFGSAATRRKILKAAAHRIHQVQQAA